MGLFPSHISLARQKGIFHTPQLAQEKVQGFCFFVFILGTKNLDRDWIRIEGTQDAPKPKGLVNSQQTNGELLKSLVAKVQLNYATHQWE